MPAEHPVRVPVRPAAPPRLLFDLQEGLCNLRCPACIVHGRPDHPALQRLRGHMPLAQARRLYAEIAAWRPRVQPQLWSEPLLARDFEVHLRAMKRYGLTVSLNTNGLLLDDAKADLMVSLGLDALFVSIDAMTVETLQRVRGTRCLTAIHDAVARVLARRGTGGVPRVGVSFTRQAANRHEAEAFVAHWLERVDVVRVGEVYQDGRRQRGVKLPARRRPCPALYDTMAIHRTGQVSVCCLDAFGETDLGNVFQSGVAAVWNGEAFGRVRRWHENGDFQHIPFCRDCNVWANFDFRQTRRGDVLICRSGGTTYYNRIDRLSGGGLAAGAPQSLEAGSC